MALKEEREIELLAFHGEFWCFLFQGVVDDAAYSTNLHGGGFIKQQCFFFFKLARLENAKKIFCCQVSRD